VILEPEEAAGLYGHPALMELLRYEAAPVAALPQRLPLAALRELLASAGRWMRPGASVRLDVEYDRFPAALPAVYLAPGTEEQHAWERRLVREGHHRRLLTDQVTVGASATVLDGMTVVKVTTDDGYASHSKALAGAATPEVVEAVAKELTWRFLQQLRHEALVGEERQGAQT
jgi:hypothetical protein